MNLPGVSPTVDCNYHITAVSLTAVTLIPVQCVNSSRSSYLGLLVF